MKYILEANNLFKKYELNSQRNKGKALGGLCKKILNLKQREVLDRDEFWALQDISLRIKQGESLALIGKNGSGKSTLLKIIAGLIRPDKGDMSINGDVRALINLGAGFDKKLTGRENIINACRMSGFSNKEAYNSVEPIVEFAELGDFIDMPVSAYSSGMYSRLGFALATHTRPDIILIDEVLSVGDVGFQNKCLKKMQSLRKDGVSMILVSHSHANISQFCETGLWINEGELKLFGESKEVLKKYLEFVESSSDSKIRATLTKDDYIREKSKSGVFGAEVNISPKIRDYYFEMIRSDGNKTDCFLGDEKIRIKYGFLIKEDIQNLNISINFYREEDGLKITTISTLNGDLLIDINNGPVECIVDIPRLNLTPGVYVVTTSIHEGSAYLYRGVVFNFRVLRRNKLHWGLIDYPYQYTVGDSKSF